MYLYFKCQQELGIAVCGICKCNQYISIKHKWKRDDELRRALKQCDEKICFCKQYVVLFDKKYNDLKEPMI